MPYTPVTKVTLLLFVTVTPLPELSVTLLSNSKYKLLLAVLGAEIHTFPFISVDAPKTVFALLAVNVNPAFGSPALKLPAPSIHTPIPVVKAVADPNLIEADAAVALCVKVIPVEARVLEVIAQPEVVPPI